LFREVLVGRDLEIAKEREGEKEEEVVVFGTRYGPFLDLSHLLPLQIVC